MLFRQHKGLRNACVAPALLLRNRLFLPRQALIDATHGLGSNSAALWHTE